MSKTGKDGTRFTPDGHSSGSQAAASLDFGQAGEPPLAVRHARALLVSLGHAGLEIRAPSSSHPAVAWARSGAMALTGRSDGPAQVCPSPLAACADGALLALDALAPGRLPRDLEGAALLGERAALAGLGRRGGTSPGGGCRLLATATTPIAVNMARESDWECVAAWLSDASWLPEAGSGEARWSELARRISRLEPDRLVDQGRALGLAIAPAAPEIPVAGRWHEVVMAVPGRAAAPGPGATGAGGRARRPLVVDLSALWAGPLCGALLAALGARVIKVESTRRPDGARGGEPRFFDLMNAGKESVALDFASAPDQRRLRELVRHADIVIEGSRPRALRQLRVDAAEILAECPALTWLSLSGYGRGPACEDWIAYGDDAGVAAGLSALLHEVTGEWLVCGDAIADPLTGLHAAVAGWASWLRGGGQLLSLALRNVVAHLAAFELPVTRDARRTRHGQWCAALAAAGIEASAPRARTVVGRGPALGEHTARVLAELGIR